jgi:hypothetical protein
MFRDLEGEDFFSGPLLAIPIQDQTEATDFFRVRECFFELVQNRVFKGAYDVLEANYEFRNWLRGSPAEMNGGLTICLDDELREHFRLLCASEDSDLLMSLWYENERLHRLINQKSRDRALVYLMYIYDSAHTVDFLSYYLSSIQDIVLIKAFILSIPSTDNPTPKHLCLLERYYQLSAKFEEAASPGLEKMGFFSTVDDSLGIKHDPMEEDDDLFKEKCLAHWENPTC